MKKTKTLIIKRVSEREFPQLKDKLGENPPTVCGKVHIRTGARKRATAESAIIEVGSIQREKVRREHMEKPMKQEDPAKAEGFFEKYGPQICLACLIAYTILLAIGTIAEVFKIQSVLDWWIWSPPGR